jgi:hypothetical protein
MPSEGHPATGDWRGMMFGAGQAVTVREPALLSDMPIGFVVERTLDERTAHLRSLRGKVTSPEIASAAAKLMHHDDPEVRKVAATALGQRAKT